MAQQAPPTLSYADPLQQLGVSVIRDGPVTRVVLPRLPGWALVFPVLGSLWPVYQLFRLVGWAVGAVRYFRSVIVGIALAAVLVPIGLSLVYLLVRLRPSWWRRRVFEIDADRVRMGYLGNGGAAQWQFTWPRAAVTVVKLNPYSGHLLVRVAGRNMQEFPISRRREVVAAVAEVLRAEILGEKPWNLPG